ncbi:hypothetical protein F2Q69_00063231, partial [Brassica cretica]
VPVDPLDWQISQDTASNIVARLDNTVGAAESVLSVAATGHDKMLFLKAISVFFCLLGYITVEEILTLRVTRYMLMCSDTYDSTPIESSLSRISGGSRSYFDPGHTYNLSTMSTEAFVKKLKKYTEILKTMVGNCPTLCPSTSATE